MPAVFLARVPVATDEVPVVVVLEDPVLFGHPGHFFPHVGTHDLDGDRGMIPRRQDVADVVYERRENHLVVGVVPFGPGSCL